MQDTLIIAIVTAVVQITGLVLANRITVYRIEQLEKKVEKHNNFMERLFKVEESAKFAHQRIDDVLEELNKKC